MGLRGLQKTLGGPPIGLRAMKSCKVAIKGNWSGLSWPRYATPGALRTSDGAESTPNRSEGREEWKEHGNDPHRNKY